VNREQTGRFGLRLVIKDCCITGPRYVAFSRGRAKPKDVLASTKYEALYVDGQGRYIICWYCDCDAVVLDVLTRFWFCFFTLVRQEECIHSPSCRYSELECRA
jgi:hypothetical protein